MKKLQISLKIFEMRLMEGNNMANFPSKWLDFTTNKEIKRLRKDVNDTLSLKIEISVSIILTIIAFCFSEYIGKMKPICQTLVCISMCLIILVIFFYPCVKKYLSQKNIAIL